MRKLILVTIIGLSFASQADILKIRNNSARSSQEKIVSVETSLVEEPRLQHGARYNARAMAITNDCAGLPRRDTGTLNSTSVEDVLNDAIGDLDPIAIGKQIWDIIVAGQPVVQTRFERVHVLPREVECWNELENWQAPKSQYYSTKFKNMFGVTMIQFDYRLNYTPAGQRDGKGRYLMNVAVMPAYVNVSWAPGGYKFNANVEVGNAVNLSSSTNPVAGIEVTVTYDVKSLLNDIKSSDSFFMQGNGAFRKMR